MFLHLVNNKQSELEWLHLPLKLYGRYPNRPLMLTDDIKKVFDKNKNSFLQQGCACRWLLYDHYNLCAGRIAAFALPGNATGQIGFFECIEDQTIAHTLFHTAKKWLLEQGCQYIEGPVNFGEKDRFWGLMIQGFETKGLYLDNFNPCYYRHFFESYGFEKKDVIYTYQLNPDRVPLKRMEQIAARNTRNGHYYFRHFCWSEEEKFVSHIHAVYSASFQAQKRIAHISSEDIRYLLAQTKVLLNEKHFWLAYQGNRPVGFIIFLREPSVNFRVPEQSKILKGFAFATIPEVRGKGVEIGLALSLYYQLKKENSTYYLMLSGINAATVTMNSLIRKLGGQLSKVHQTFTYKINNHE